MDFPYTHSVVLLPEQRISDAMITISRTIRGDTYFQLGVDDYVPHVSLYMFHCPAGSLDGVIDAVSTIAAATHPLDLNQPRLLHPGQGYHEVAYAVTADLIGLQHAVLEAINPLRGPNPRKIDGRAADQDADQSAAMIKYGYRNVGQLFRPHVTLTRFCDEREHSIDLGVDDLSGRADQLAIYELGDHGTCRKQVAVVGLI